MSVLLLITEQEVKDLTSLTDNTDVANFRHHIQVAQDEYVKPAIGETCYDALLDSVEGESFTALQLVLLDGDNRSFSGLKTALAWRTLWLAYPDLWLAISNSTISKKTSEKFVSVSTSEFNIKRETANRTASHYETYLIKYIQKNSDDYTCYTCEGITPLVDESTFTGLALDNDKIIRRSPEQDTINYGG